MTLNARLSPPRPNALAMGGGRGRGAAMDYYPMNFFPCLCVSLSCSWGAQRDRQTLGIRLFSVLVMGSSGLGGSSLFPPICIKGYLQIYFWGCLPGEWGYSHIQAI